MLQLGRLNFVAERGQLGHDVGVVLGVDDVDGLAAPSCALRRWRCLGSSVGRADLGRRVGHDVVLLAMAGPGLAARCARTRVASRRLSAEAGAWAGAAWVALSASGPARRRRPGGHRAGPARHGSWGGPRASSAAGHPGTARHLDAQAHHGRWGDTPGLASPLAPESPPPPQAVGHRAWQRGSGARLKRKAERVKAGELGGGTGLAETSKENLGGPGPRPRAVKTPVRQPRRPA